MNSAKTRTVYNDSRVKSLFTLAISGKSIFLNEDYLMISHSFLKEEEECDLRGISLTFSLKLSNTFQSGFKQFILGENFTDMRKNIILSKKIFPGLEFEHRSPALRTDMLT